MRERLTGFLLLSTQDALANELRVAVESKDEVISKQKGEIDRLHAAADESSRSISNLNEKVSKLDSQRKDVGSKLESAQGEISKLSQELGAKVNLFAQPRSTVVGLRQ